MLNKIVLGLLVCLSVSAQALDENRLWLPVKYHKYYLDLKESALAAEALENCSEVLRGVIDLEQSSKGHPIFRILCRRPDGISYNEMVDGLSKQTLTTQLIEETLSAEELERLRLEEEARLAKEEALQQERFSRECERLLVEKTRLMLEMQRLTPAGAEPDEFSMLAAAYTVDFNAVSIGGQPLKYQSLCRVQVTEGEVLQAEVIIKPRR
ncbi:hypothetical protein SAMN02745866_03881 [Alteromonadaceae bacterium Bs31]|nr:hypothetical protein SAMN02745866_03881 [Alteromonadaceae bacterium Bs31]